MHRLHDEKDEQYDHQTKATRLEHGRPVATRKTNEAYGHEHYSQHNDGRTYIAELQFKIEIALVDKTQKIAVNNARAEHLAQIGFLGDESVPQIRTLFKYLLAALSGGRARAG